MSGSLPPTAEEYMALGNGLRKPLPEISPRYFYDDLGSELFEKITYTDAYYQTRTEFLILERHAAELLRIARPRHIAELGSGAGRKIRMILDAWLESGCSCESVTMLDINALFLQNSLETLAGDYPTIRFSGIVGDFTKDLAQLGPGGSRLLLFFAGTIGNLYPAERQRFFEEIAAQMAPDDTLLIGVDLIKDADRLNLAYNDPEGITAAFNLNALQVLNRRFGADFDPTVFEHRAFFDPEKAWIEMRLVALRDTTVTIPGASIERQFSAGSEIRTEISCKFNRDSLAAAAAAGGLALVHWVTDPDSLFGIALLRRTP